MGEGSNLLNLILLAIAVGVFLKLRSVLGRRTGNERPPYDPYSAPEKTPSGNDKVIALPKRAQPGAQQQAQTDEAPRPDRWAGIVPEGSALSQTLTEISLADRAFDAGAFLSGARMAYEMIVTAFARGDRQTLQPLLDEHVFKSFSDAVADREAKGETVEQTFIGIDKAELTGASLEGSRARLTVRFMSELTSCVKNRDGIVIEGDPVTIRQVTDIWTFERDVKNRDPNWRLVATGAA
jgi:predicted lipid-binding transport protein (Tim44 family)